MNDKFNCECCNFITNNKTKFKRHLQTQKHQKYSSNIALYSNDIALYSPNIALTEKKPAPIMLYKCKYCEKVLQHQSSLSRHIKYSCKHKRNVVYTWWGL